MGLYTVSYPLDNREHFKFKDDYGLDICVKAIKGLARFQGTDNEVGRVKLETDVEFRGVHEVNGITIASVAELSYCGDNKIVTPEGSERFVTEAPEYWRICYRRNNKDWRVRNEHQSTKIFYVDTYEGIINIDWFDRTAHLYHWGEVWHTPDNHALFIPYSGVPQRPESVEKAVANREVSIYASV